MVYNRDAKPLARGPTVARRPIIHGPRPADNCLRSNCPSTHPAVFFFPLGPRKTQRGEGRAKGNYRGGGTGRAPEKLPSAHPPPPPVATSIIYQNCDAVAQ